jgi:molybdopterin synthase catalytic subunit
MPDYFTSLSADPLDVTAVLARVADPSCGGIGLFVGTVRDSAAVRDNSERPVVRLEYEAHEALAEATLAGIAKDAVAKWDVRKLVAVHRTGTCELGEPTVVVAASAPHRGDALEACRYVIDTIKSSVPIFKKEVYADGSAWVGTEGAASGA